MSYHATAPSTQRLPGQIDSGLDADQSALDMIAETAKRGSHGFAPNRGLQPVQFAQRIERWDRHDLDSWLDSFKSGDFHDTDVILARLG